MKVSTWKAGTYGIRVGVRERAQHFKPAWTTVDVEIDGQRHRFDLSEKFWTTCPELRGGEIAQWILRQGLGDWPYRQPHKVGLIPLAPGVFRLNR